MATLHRHRIVMGILAGLFACWLSGAARGEAADTLDIYFIDVGAGVGNATLVVSPAGDSMMLDSGPPYAARRVLEVLKVAGVEKLGFLVTTHYHADHFGATSAIAENLKINRFVDHGESVELGKSDDWWKERRGPWFHPGMGKTYDTLYQNYMKARVQSHQLVVQPGDAIPVSGISVRVLSAGGQVLARPLPGAGAPNPACEAVDRRADDDAEDDQSIGVLVSFGAFRFVYLGDLTWNKANALFCPNNNVGTVDAYLITHHAQSFPASMGAYYHGLSACPKSEVHGLRPRVAILSLGAHGHREGDSAAMDVVKSSPGLEDVWQTNRVVDGGESGSNAPEDFCANTSGRNDQARFIKLSARNDGSFTMSNSRNGFSKDYPHKDQGK